MRPVSFLLGMAVVVGALAGGLKGTAPRTDASRYPAHAAQDVAAMGAALLSPEQARRAFASDVARRCVVVEVGIYPGGGKPLEVALGDFTLRLAGTETAVKPSSAKTLAAVLQKTAPSQRDITVYPSVEVGYESGPRTYDPVTGERRGGGLRTSAGVGVGVGDSRPASTDRDRDTMELELGEKGLPEGVTSAPVAGYLYFALPSHSRRKNAAYQLEYKLGGSQLVLRLP